MEDERTTIPSGGDAIALLKAQHEQIRRLFEGVLQKRDERREQTFRELRRLLTIHEMGEEAIVHPAATRSIPRGETVVAQSLTEESEAKRALTRLEQLDCSSPEFEAGLRVLETKMLAHAEREEREEFDALASNVSQDRLMKMRNAVELAESRAPTHPHPHPNDAPAATLVGPFDGIVDRARDALSAFKRA